jgi:hypothetical protein
MKVQLRNPDLSTRWGGQFHALATCTQGEEYPVLIKCKAGWAPEPVWKLEYRTRVPAENRTPAVQAVADRYTD